MYRSSVRPFLILVDMQARPHRGQIRAARNLRAVLLLPSSIQDSHKNCGQVQDSYSLRCIPQVPFSPLPLPHISPRRSVVHNSTKTGSRRGARHHPFCAGHFGDRDEQRHRQPHGVVRQGEHQEGEKEREHFKQLIDVLLT
jgi:hypothetical protein